MTEIDGYVEDGFEGVRDAFLANFDLQPDMLGQLLGHDVCEVGAAVSVWQRGRKVVDLWGGEADRRDHSPYTEDTLQLVFSTTKGVTAIAANLLVQRGELDLDAKVADYWPEFGQAGKADIPVRWLLSHQIGLPDVDRPMTKDQALAWDPVIEALADSEPVWEPGTQHGYHAVTYGWLVGEIIRRVSGKSLGTFFADEVAAPLGLDFWIGTPDEQHDRVSPLIVMGAPEGLVAPPVDGEAPPGLVEMLEMLLGPGNLAGRALTAPGGAFAEQDEANNTADVPVQLALG
jgi:CubicO group peptidase (beta-lactamase class C family)